MANELQGVTAQHREMLAVAQKAHRLVAEGRVEKLHDRLFVVRGDTDSYLVPVVDLARAKAAGVSPALCQCQRFRMTGLPCSHHIAAREVHRMEQEALGS